VTHTVTGQARDIYIEYQGGATEEEILSMYENKTARYSIEGPLHLGWLLAGGDEQVLELYSRYAIPIGIAYQIQDDILGVFGDEKAIGKPVGSDIAEGKYTLLVAKAMELGTKSQRDELTRILGIGEGITYTDIQAFRVLLEETGAVAVCNKKAKEATEEGLAVLPELKKHLTEEAFQFLTLLTTYLLERKS